MLDLAAALVWFDTWVPVILVLVTLTVPDFLGVWGWSPSPCGIGLHVLVVGRCLWSLSICWTALIVKWPRPLLGTPIHYKHWKRALRQISQKPRPSILLESFLSLSFPSSLLLLFLPFPSSPGFVLFLLLSTNRFLLLFFFFVPGTHKALSRLSLSLFCFQPFFVLFWDPFLPTFFGFCCFESQRHPFIQHWPQSHLPSSLDFKTTLLFQKQKQHPNWTNWLGCWHSFFERFHLSSNSICYSFVSYRIVISTSI